VTGQQGQNNQALDVADFEIDDILSTPDDRLLAEVGEDFGDPTVLVAEFDAIALSLLSGTPRGEADRTVATGVSAAVEAAAGIASWRASPPALPSVASSFRHAMSAAAPRWAAPLRNRAALGALATLVLLAALAPELYPLLVRVPAERPAPSFEIVPARPVSLPQPTPPPTAALPSAAASRLAPPPDSAPPAAADQDAAAPAEPVPQRAAMAPPEPDAKPMAVGRQRRAAAEAQLNVPPPSPGSGFVVQLSTLGSEAQARSSFRTLKSKYAVLKDHEPLIRRTDDGRRGASYALEVGPFGSWEEADRLCARLKAAGGDCSVHGN